MAVWWKRSKATISCLHGEQANFEQELDYRSGRNPLLLRGVVEALSNLEGAEGESDLQTTMWSRIHKNCHWKLVADQIHKFVTDAQRRGGEWEARCVL